MKSARNQSGAIPPEPVIEGSTRAGENGERQREKPSLSKNSTLLWTGPMLAALARGNDGRCWHTLIDKVWSPKSLGLALDTVVARKGAPGIDGQSTQAVSQRSEEEIALIGRLLGEGKYEPRPVKRVWIEKFGSSEKRPLGIPTVRDRIVQSALLQIIEPIFEGDFAAHSYGFRPGRSARQAVERVEKLMGEGKVWVVDADIRGYFDNIPQEQLLARVKEKIADSRVIELIAAFLRQGVMEDMKEWKPTEVGTPQGAVISPLLANIYLNPLDHLMERQGYEMVRYADDFVILCESREEAEAALEKVRQWMEVAGLSLHPEKTRVVDARERGGFDFLGWHFERGYKWPRKKSQGKFKDSIRRHTRRSNGHSLKTIITKVNRVVVGWGNYFRGGVRNQPEKLEGWVRKRIGSILRRRDGRDGPSRGLDHNRYPNAWLTAQGLISLTSITHGAAASPAKTRTAQVVADLCAGKH